MEGPTDIVIITRNRASCLLMTLEYIMDRTSSPYALHVVDDASHEENAAMLLAFWREGKIETCTLSGERRGPNANLNVGTWLSFSDPVVFTDDDVLCPDVEPDWLARGLAAMEERPQLGILALNHPGQPRHPQESDGAVTYCKRVGGTFMFVRRCILEDWHLKHKRDNVKNTPTMQRCFRAEKLGYRIGYLTETYCHHIGTVSERTGKKYPYPMIKPIDSQTLEPPLEWRG